VGPSRGDSRSRSRRSGRYSLSRSDKVCEVIVVRHLFALILFVPSLVVPCQAGDRRLKIVVFGGHPDDPESGAGGLVATLTRQGHEVICAYGTTFRGDRQFFFEVMTDQQTIAFAPDLYLDIAPVREVKKRSLDEHKSQEPDEIWQVHERMHRRRGAECGVEFAEAYKLVEAKHGCPLLPLPFRQRIAGSRAPASK
jgi:hypothetical protein